MILVSSGAVGVGCQRLGLTERPTVLAQKQALAAVGQVHLMRFYEDLFHALGLVGGAGGLQCMQQSAGGAGVYCQAIDNPCWCTATRPLKP